VAEANPTLRDKPETINSDPHGAAWLVKIRLANPTELDKLMDSAAYEAYVAAKGKEASA
jgi:glycine cleavage system H protein